ncbi:uncharacterized protein LOC131011494 [Salvia miltiorrhiza]|uniref:uncharacterized protein LOC131003918 n=1 Tax=Salvia miltiorrhiza TaxID=226208 RepID=UPI0025AD7FCE|nr:uncharacterized protein LOC131003918 [Salvia miltiorrhiza]XP_057795265.1 uncharacterized protein LOC131011494 [Salvia miltiorrhiza]
MWRIMRNRLPTCDNLVKRRIPLGEEEVLCNACCQREESAQHLFLRCPKTEMVWNEIQKWVGVDSVRPDNVEAHFEAFSNLGTRKTSSKFLSVLWACTTWLIWKGRNESRFESKNWEIAKMLGGIKARLWSWNKIFNLLEGEVSFHDWMTKDISYLFV